MKKSLICFRVINRVSILIASILLIANLFADEITLKDGMKIQGKITAQKKGKFAKIETATGEKIIPWHQITAIDIRTDAGNPSVVTRSPQNTTETIPRRNSILASAGLAGSDGINGEGKVSTDFSAGVDYWYTFNYDFRLGLSGRMLPTLDSTTTISSITTKTSATLYPIVLQASIAKFIVLGAGYAPASGRVTVNGKSATYSGGSGTFALMGGIGFGGVMEGGALTGLALQLDVARFYYYPELKTYGLYFGLGIGFGWE